MEWKETARWIKFEETVEDGDRWGKPHVASLTFHSLLELRKGLEKGINIHSWWFDLPITLFLEDILILLDHKFFFVTPGSESETGLPGNVNFIASVLMA